MKLLIVTQAVDADSSVLGFFLEWLKEFARQCEEVHVIGLAVGRHSLPANVSVYSMGKERGLSKFSRLANYWKHLGSVLPKVDGVFIHMCPEYLIAGWPRFALTRKPVVLWYAHKAVNLRMRLASFLADGIATSTRRAYSLKSDKVTEVGQGVPTGFFVPAPGVGTGHRLVTVGRITPIKRLELMIGALEIVRKAGIPATLDVIGEAVMPTDREYEARLRALIKEKGLDGAVDFVGAVPFADFPARYARYAAALNAAPTGAPDKAALEAMSCGLPLVAANRTFAEMLGPDADRCAAEATAESMAAKILGLLKDPDPGLGGRLRDIVRREHSVEGLVRKVLGLYPNVSK